MHSVQVQVRRLVQDKDAHYLAVIKGNQPWDEVPIAHTASQSGHGRRESRSLRTLTLAASTGGPASPTADRRCGCTAAARRPGANRGKIPAPM
ncbi:hypothetical protein AB5J49_03100 [Streptomyces sp. R28]|uniref:Uncharacterized protein n=1 Tax=Streptomyces sp. R28 TaxID=3238628 RepID=A0AB39PTG8_9ACTN